ncbi:MAG: hypothetical protein U1E39_00405 [Planctomycetota bacterium]
MSIRRPSLGLSVLVAAGALVARAHADDTPPAPPPAVAPAPAPGAARDADFVPPTQGPAAALAKELAAVHAETDPTKQRTALLAMHKTSRDALLSLDAGALASLAPDVLRVYDLAGALASGGDGAFPAWWTFPDVPEATWPVVEPTPAAAVVRRATRIGGAVADCVKPPTIAAPTFVDVWTPTAAPHDPLAPHACVVVLGGPDDLTRAEAALERVATVGGRGYAVAVDVLESAAWADRLGLRALAAGASRDATGLASMSAADRASARIAHFALPTPAGRRATAWRAFDRSYVKDYDVEVGNDNVVEPIVGVLREGVGATAVVDVATDGGRALRVDVKHLRAPTPLPTFSTSLAGRGTEAVTIEVPKLELVRGSVGVPDDGRARTLLLRLGTADTFAIVEVTPTATTPAARGWARVAPGAPPAGIVDARVASFTFTVEANAGRAPLRAAMSSLAGQEATLTLADRPDGDRIDVTARCDAPAADGSRVVDVVVTWRTTDPSPRTMPKPETRSERIELPVARAVSRPFRFRLAPGASETARDVGGAPLVTVTYEAPSTKAVVAELERRAGLASPSPRVSTRPDDAALAAVRGAPAREQAAAVRGLVDASEAGFLMLTPAELATLAPDVLRVYDLSAALAHGDDATPPPAFAKDAPATSLAPDGSTPAPAVSRRAARIAHELRTEVEDGFALARAGGTPAGAPTTVVVCVPSRRFDAVERALDRLATTGGPVVRLDVEVVRAGAGAPIATYTLEVPHNRSVAAWRHVRHAYLETPEAGAAKAAGRPLAPVVRTWADGIGLVASVGEGGAGSDPQVHLSVAASFGVDAAPPPGVAPRGPRAGVELPALVQRQLETAWPVPAEGMVATERLGDSDLAVRVRATRGAAAPVARGWTRVTAEPKPPAAPRVATLEAVWTAQQGGQERKLQSPTVRVFEGQTATISIVHQVPYIAGAEVSGRPGAWLVDPIVQSLPYGLVVEATVRPEAGGMHVVEGRFLRMAPDTPVRTRPWDFGVGTPMNVELPVMREVSRPFRASLAPGGSVSIPMPALPSDRTRNDTTSTTLTLTLTDVRSDEAPAPTPSK